MGRHKKLPLLPPKSEEVATAPMPPPLKPESLEQRKREIAMLARMKLDDNFDPVVDRIFALDEFQPLVVKEAVIQVLDKDVLRLKLETLKWLTDRGYGKAPQIVKIGADEGPPEGILAEIARKRTEELASRLEADKLRAEAIPTEVVPA